MNYPAHYIVFDTETLATPYPSDAWKETLQLRLGVAKYYKHIQNRRVLKDALRFKSSEEFHDWVESKAASTNKLWVFAHNIGFDLRIVDFWRYVGEGFYGLTPPPRNNGKTSENEIMVVMDDPPTMIKTFTTKGYEIFWSDTYQWFSCSLKKLGEQLKYPKGDMPEFTESDKEWFDYCERDVDVLNEGLIKIWDWLESQEVQTFCPTRAAQSLQIFDQLYEGKTVIRHDNAEASALERKAYYGGFTDLFYRGSVTGPINQVDVNSLYPYVMKSKWFPVKLIEHAPYGRMYGADCLKKPKQSTAHVRLLSNDDTYPLRTKEGTLFVRGKVETVLAGPELERAVKDGHVVDVLSYNVYDTSPLFHQFVSDFWRYRQQYKDQGDDVSQLIVKLLMNSLYGKFGQQTPEWVYFGEEYSHSTFFQGHVKLEDDDAPRNYRVLAGKTYIQGVRSEAKKSFVAIASFVTSYAREYMRSIRQFLPSHSYYYQATDSLYVNDEGLYTLEIQGYLDNSKLGKFKAEGVYDSCRFTNIHHIDKGDVKVRGSIRSKAEPLGEERYKVERWESFPVATFQGVTDQVRVGSLIKTLKGDYYRGKVGDDGWVVPWRVDNWGVSPDVIRSQSFRKYLACDGPGS